MSDPYDEGRMAHAAGMPRHDNPHDLNSEAWCRWMDGFDQAATEADYHTPRPANGHTETLR